MTRKARLLCILSIAFGTLLILAAVAFALIWNGVILLNNPSHEKYPVRGIDVSAYQGSIEWDVLSKDIAFAFIKATEGSSFVDERFEYNYSMAQKTGLRVGAYHFFSYDSSGKTQAENFIKTVPKIDNMLPPVIDIEFYGDKEKNPPDRIETQKQLDILIEQLYMHYKVKPVIYATKKSYELYIEEAYNEYDIWIRDVVTAPKLADDRQWTFWQYTNREVLDGYDGNEKYIDMNVFWGTQEAFESYPNKLNPS